MAVKMDKKDREILYQLDLDSRQSMKQIARKVKLSREVVQYRVRRLERNGVIRGYLTMIDVSRLGLLSCRIFIKFQKSTPEEEKEIIDYYIKHPKFWWVDRIGGFIDFGVACWVRDMHEFYELKEDLSKRFGRFLHTIIPGFYHKFYIYPRNYLTDSPANVPEKVMFHPGKAKFDDKDIEILRLLAPNARRSSLEISRKMGLSTSNVSRRIRAMISRGIIKSFRVIIDLEKMGYYWYKLEIQLDDLSVKSSMLGYFRKHPNIVYGYETVSDNDIEVEVEVMSFEAFREIMNEIRKIYGRSIRKYHYFMWQREDKFLFMPEMPRRGS